MSIESLWNSNRLRVLTSLLVLASILLAACSTDTRADTPQSPAVTQVSVSIARMLAQCNDVSILKAGYVTTQQCDQFGAVFDMGGGDELTIDNGNVQYSSMNSPVVIVDCQPQTTQVTADAAFHCEVAGEPAKSFEIFQNYSPTQDTSIAGVGYESTVTEIAPYIPPFAVEGTGMTHSDIHFHYQLEFGAMPPGPDATVPNDEPGIAPVESLIEVTPQGHLHILDGSTFASLSLFQYHDDKTVTECNGTQALDSRWYKVTEPLIVGNNIVVTPTMWYFISPGNTSLTPASSLRSMHKEYGNRAGEFFLTDDARFFLLQCLVHYDYTFQNYAQETYIAVALPAK